MLDTDQIENLITLATSMDRRQVTQKLLDFSGSFPVDFTPEFLAAMSIERLQHVYVALCLQLRAHPKRPRLWGFLCFFAPPPPPGGPGGGGGGPRRFNWSRSDVR